jgi:hypothetical protein
MKESSTVSRESGLGREELDASAGKLIAANTML